MNVYVVSFDESQDANDPLLRVFGSRVQMAHAVRLMAVGTNYADEIERELDTGGDFTLIRTSSAAGGRVVIRARACPVEEAEAILTKGRL